MFNTLDYAFISVQNTLALNVKGVLEDGASAMENGGALAPLAQEVDAIGGGIYHISYKGVVYAILVAFILGGAALAFSNGANRQEKKDNMKWRIVGGAVALAATGIIILLETVGSGLFTGTNMGS